MKKASVRILLIVIALSSCGPLIPIKSTGTLAPLQTATSTNTSTSEPTITATTAVQMWEVVRSPVTQLYDMAVLPNNEIWVVGTPDLIVHSYLSDYLVNDFSYSGTYSPANSDAFNSVHFLASNDGWVASYGGKIFHWDGSKWTKVLDSNFWISDMGFSDKNNGWAVGSGDSDETILLHWNGKEWQNISLQDAIGRDNFYLWSIDAVSNTNVWAVGVDNYGKGVALNWDGSNWRETPYQGDEIKVVSGISQTDVWGVGGKNGNIILHWDGEKWTETELSAFYLINFSILAISQDNVWAGGHDLVHWNGSKWVNTFYNGNQGPIYDIETTPDGEAWALTGDGSILHLK